MLRAPRASRRAHHAVLQLQHDPSPQDGGVQLNAYHIIGASLPTIGFGYLAIDGAITLSRDTTGWAGIGLFFGLILALPLLALWTGIGYLALKSTKGARPARDFANAAILAGGIGFLLSLGACAFA